MRNGEVLAYGIPLGHTITFGGGIKKQRGTNMLNNIYYGYITNNSQPAIKLPETPGDAEAGALSAGQKAVAVGNYLKNVKSFDDADTDTNRQAFLGNIIKLRGGILLSDKLGGKVNSGE